MAVAIDWRAEASKVVLSPGERALISGGRVSTGEAKTIAVPGRRQSPFAVGFTQSDGIKLCLSDQEAVFVEALLVHTHVQVNVDKVDMGTMMARPDDVQVPMTHDQHREIADVIRPGIRWSPEQYERLKAKYIGRPKEGKPARRFELFREALKGRKEPGQATGFASELTPTGIVALLTTRPADGVSHV